MTNDVTIAAIVFLVTYALIASDRINKTIAALLGGLAMIILRVIGQEEGFHAVDFNVIFLLAGMMVLAGILRRTGFFQWVAIRFDQDRERPPLPADDRVERRHRGPVGPPRQRHDGRPDRARHAVDRLDPRRRTDPVPRRRDPRLEHRRHRHAHRRPAEHPDRLGFAPRLRRFPHEHGPGGVDRVRRVPRHAARPVRRAAHRHAGSASRGARPGRAARSSPTRRCCAAASSSSA